MKILEKEQTCLIYEMYEDQKRRIEKTVGWYPKNGWKVPQIKKCASLKKYGEFRRKVDVAENYRMLMLGNAKCK